MMTLKKFHNYADTTTYNEKNDEWELSKPMGGMKLKQRIRDAINILLNRGIVVRWI